MTNSDFPATEFRTLDELVELISAATRGWDTRWYRGVKSPHHRLLPKLLRDKRLAKREGYISIEFRRRARVQLNGITTSFDWLCAMQHYGLPTRLLDWTESLPVALFFTTYPADLDLIAPTVWVLDPFRLHQCSFANAETIPIATDVNVIANADIAFEDDYERLKKERTKLPLPVAPDFLFQRLAAQNGCFTIHGTNNCAVEECLQNGTTALLKFVARKDCVPKLYESIDFLKPSSDAIFPDIEGLKDYIV